MDGFGAGLRAIAQEMQRQRSDARRSFDASGAVASLLAGGLRAGSRLVLAGMGGSHAVNRVAEPLYRRAGIDAAAHPLSELIAARCRPRRGA